MGRRKGGRDLFQASLFDEVFQDDASDGSGLSGGIDMRIRPDSVAESELATPIGGLKESHYFRFMSFGSGSSGNCSYLGTENGGILIDAGVDLKKVVEELAKNNIRPESIKGICLTHDHGDHIRYAYPILRKYRTMALFCTNRVLNGILRRHNVSRRIKDYHVAIYKEIPFKAGDFEITAFDVPHDGSCNSGFSIGYRGTHFVVATDLGSVTDRARHYMLGANYLVLESNYDATMLEEGSYPFYLKSRIRAANGHLDNADAAAFLKEIYSKQLKYVFLCHLSHDNNRPEIARSEVEQALSGIGVTIGKAEDSLDDRTKDLQLAVLPRYDATRCFKFFVDEEL